MISAPRLLGAAAATFLLVSTGGAQEVARQQVLSTNVLGIPFGYYNVEYERAAGANVSLGVSGSYFTFLVGGGDDPVYTALDARVRIYPTTVLRGFSVGLSGGYFGVGTGGVDDGGATVGTTIEYQWLLGAERKFAFALGGGFKRVLLIDGNTPDVTAFYPTLRTSIGYAF
jgi:hypothetical protein